MAPENKDIFLAFNAFNNTQKQFKNNRFKIKIVKFDMFINNRQHFNK